MANTFNQPLQDSPHRPTRTCKEACTQAFCGVWTRYSGTACQVSKISYGCFKRFPLTCFVFRAIIHQHITQCFEKAQERIAWLLKLEDKPFSLNTHYLADYRAKYLAHFKGSREQQDNMDLIKYIDAHNLPPPPPPPAIFSTEATIKPVDPFDFFQPSVKSALASLAAIGLTGVKAEDLPKLLPPDRMEPALVIMADVRAYFQGGFFFCCLLTELLFIFLLFQWHINVLRTMSH